MAVKFVLDTSAYSDFNRGLNGLEKFMNTENELYMPIIVIGELRAGFELGSKKQENEQLLCDFLDAPNVQVLKITDKTTKKYASIYKQLRTDGKPIGTNDMWIAALCLENDLSLLTTDRDFQNVANLTCL